MKVGYRSPGITTEKSDAYDDVCTDCDCRGFSIDPDSKLDTSVTSSEKAGFVGLKRCSKMAMIRNIDIKIAVATKPNEIAFMDDPMFFNGGASLVMIPG